jgi:hypothetical protein
MLHEVGDFRHAPIAERAPDARHRPGEQIGRQGCQQFHVHRKARSVGKLELAPGRELGQRRQDIFRITRFQIALGEIDGQRQVVDDVLWNVRQMDERLVAPGVGPGKRPPCPR